MAVALEDALRALREHESELRRRGVRRAAVFGSVARGQATAASDVDILVELDPEAPLGLFEYARLKLDIAMLLDGRADVVNRATLKPLLRDRILNEAVDAF